MITLYHYTNAAGAEGIGKTGTIKQSLQKDGSPDAVGGSGVYMTDTTPQNIKLFIAQEIFDDISLPKLMVAAGRLDYYVKIRIFENQVEQPMPYRPHVYLYPDEDLVLNDPNVVKEFTVCAMP